MRIPIVAGASLALALLACGLLTCNIMAFDEPKKEAGFVSIFDGKTLKGWHVSGKTVHGTGGLWVVKDGAIVGTQDRPGNRSVHHHN